MSAHLSSVVGRFGALVRSVLPAGSMVTVQTDRRGRLVLHTIWPADGSARIVLRGEILSSYRTATQEQRALAQTRFQNWLRKRLAVESASQAPRDWVIEPGELFEAEE